MRLHALHAAVINGSKYCYTPICEIKDPRNISYSGLFSWVETFVKSWKKLPKLNFKFRSAIFQSWMTYCELWTWDTWREIWLQKDETLQFRVLRERLVSQARPNQPQRGLVSDYSALGLVWSGLWDYAAREAIMSTKTFGRPVLENNYYTKCENGCSVCHGGCQEAILGSYVLNKRYWSRFLFCLLHFSVHFLSHHTWDSLRMRTLWIKDTVNEVQVAKRDITKTSAVQIWAHVDSATLCCKFRGYIENFVTPGWTTKITKISTPWK